MTTQTKRPHMLLWLDGNRGIYIPQHFAESFKDRVKSVTGVSDEDWKVLESGPDHEWYWEAWNSVCDHAVVTDDDGVKYRVHQDGDCWLIPEGMEYNEKTDAFEWPAVDEG